MVLKKIEDNKLIFIDNVDNFDIDVVVPCLNRYARKFEKFLNIDIDFLEEYKKIQNNIYNLKGEWSYDWIN